MDSSSDSQPDPSRIQPGSVDRARRRRLLHRDLDVRMVSRCADSPLTRSRALGAGGAAAQSRQSARHAGRSRLVRCLGAVPHVCRRAVSSRLHRREALRPRYGAGAAGASLRDFHNYLVTSAGVDGDWSDPVALNSSGFDPSLFHDDDGRKYLVNMLWDHRPGHNRFGGIVLQEYSPAERAAHWWTARSSSAPRSASRRRRTSTSATAGTT